MRAGWLATLVSTAALLSGHSVVQAGEVSGALVVAVRSDAKPFVYEADDGTMAGFIYDLCAEGIMRSNRQIGEHRRIDAAQRFGADADADVDLICDPSTITRTRMQVVDFSPIIFIANAGFYQRKSLPFLGEAAIAESPDCQRVHQQYPARRLVGAGMVAGTTAVATFDLARTKGTLTDSVDYSVCRVEVTTHAEGIPRFCSGDLGYYIGDVDILHAQMATQKNCPVGLESALLTYEPYALAIPSKDPEFRRAFNAALYSIFADGTALEFYRKTFGKQAMSESLLQLFAINSVPIGDFDAN